MCVLHWHSATYENIIEVLHSTGRGGKGLKTLQLNMTLLVPGIDCLHRNGDDITDLRAVQRDTTERPGAKRRIQGTFVFIDAPTLTETLGGRSFEGQQHSSDHD